MNFLDDTSVLAPILINIAKLLGKDGPATVLVFAIAYAMGLWFFVSGGHLLAKAGNDNREGYLSAGMWSIVWGMVSVYLPTYILTGTDTMFGTTTSVFAYQSANSMSMQEDMRKYIVAILKFVSFIGLLALVNSISVFRKCSMPPQMRPQDATVQKGLLYFGSGIVALNIDLAVMAYQHLNSA